MHQVHDVASQEMTYLFANPFKEESSIEGVAHGSDRRPNQRKLRMPSRAGEDNERLPKSITTFVSFAAFCKDLKE
jgi:hypothetical protein